MGYREKCLAAKGKECVECGTSKKIVVHHVDGSRINNDIDNLIPVCDSCHKKIHWGVQGYEKWHEKLPPRSQFGNVDPDQKTTITINQVVADRLRDMKRIGESWDSFMIRIIEETAVADDLEEEIIAEAVMNQIQDDIQEISDTAVENVQSDASAIADMVSEQVIDYIKTMQAGRVN